MSCIIFFLVPSLSILNAEEIFRSIMPSVVTKNFGQPDEMHIWIESRQKYGMHTKYINSKKVDMAMVQEKQQNQNELEMIFWVPESKNQANVLYERFKESYTIKY